MVSKEMKSCQNCEKLASQISKHKEIEELRQKKLDRALGHYLRNLQRLLNV